MNQDPFGVAIAHYYQGNKKANITVNSTITQNEKIKVSALFRTYRGMPEIERVALDACKGKILDIGAGSGAHSIVLQKRKLEVTALDLSPLACDIMLQRGIHQVIHHDIFTYQEKGFDTMLMLMNGIGIAGTIAGLDKLLLHLKSLLNFGGKIYLESTDIMYMFVEEDGSMLIDLNGAYYGELEYAIHYENHSSTFPWLYLDYATLETHALSAGFACTQVLADDDASYLACLTLIP
jgi:SAM-dependent methyltransferase